MSKVDFKLNLQGLNQLMTGPEMQAVINRAGQEVESRAYSMAQIPGAEYSRTLWVGRWICASQIHLENYEARKDNYKHNTLLKARGGG